jgi:LPXTG-motif cell wall-anchored protein
MKKILVSNFLALTLALGAVALTHVPAPADAPLVTITGTVVSIEGDVLTLSTDKGNLRFDLDKDTEKPANLAVGNRITVSYDSDDKVTDKMDARRIVMAPAASTPTPTPVTQTTPSEPAQTMSPAEPQTHTELPQTASPLPLVAGLGILALAGALLLRKRIPQD